MRPAIPTALGATPDQSGTTFSLWSDAAAAVEVCLFDEGGNETRFAMDRHEGPIWQTRLAGVGAGQRYGFRVHGDWNPNAGLLFNSQKLLIDPYAHHIDGELQYRPEIYPTHGHEQDQEDSSPFVPRSVVTDNAPRWINRPQIPWNKTVIYEAHVRGMTFFNNELPPEIRGTYSALGHESVIAYLTKLGISAIELLPIHHFVTEPSVAARGRSNLWGYNPLAFSAPHSLYAATDNPVTELQEAVDRLHDAGIEVLLDVVYNHTAEGGANGPILSMKGIDNRAYYRLDGGHYVDYTGCGNTLNSASPYVARFVTDSLRWWAEVIGVDGFRFDLLSAIARDDHGFDPRARLITSITSDPVLRDLKLISEPWDTTGDGYGVGSFPEPWREWNDKYRDGVRSFWLSPKTGHPGVRDVAYRVAGSSDVYARRDPTTSINFITAHDGFTMHDLVSWNHKHNLPNGESNADGTDNNRSWNCGVEGPTNDAHVIDTRLKLHRSLMATLLLSAGIPMITMGDEVGRSQNGSNNAYTLSREGDPAKDWGGGWALPWQLEKWQSDLLATTSALTQLRQLHPLLAHHQFFTGRTNPATMRKDIAWFAPDGQEVSEASWHDPRVHTLGYHIESSGDDADSLLVILHAGSAETHFTLPSAPWATKLRLVLDTRTGQPVAGDIRTDGGNTVTIASHSVQVWLVES